MTGDVVAEFGVRIAGDLVGAHDIERLAGLRIGARVDRAVRHDDRRLVMLEQGGKGADRRFVAGDDGDRAGQSGGTQMLAQRVVRHLAADQRIAHLARSVADAVGGGDRVLGLDQPQLELVRSLADVTLELGMDRLDLRHHAEIALAVALGADDADGRLVNQVGVGPERARHADGLGGTAGMAVDDDGARFHFCTTLGVVEIGSGLQGAPARMGRNMPPKPRPGERIRARYGQNLELFPRGAD